MSTIANFSINGLDIKVLYHSEQWCPFGGQKITHPFETRPYGKFGLVYDGPKISFEEGTRFFVKMDGSCGQYVDGVPRRRYDRRAKKVGGVFKWKDLPLTDDLNYIECSPEPPCEAQYHWPFMCDVPSDTKLIKQTGGKWFADAAKNFSKTKFFSAHKTVAGEWMGPQLKPNVSDPLDENTFIPFNLVEFEVPSDLQSYEGFKALFEAVGNIEGLVAYSPKGDIHKIRRTMFYSDKDERALSWDKETPEECVMPAPLREAFAKDGVRNFAQYIANRL